MDDILKPMVVNISSLLRSAEFLETRIRKECIHAAFAWLAGSIYFGVAVYQYLDDGKLAWLFTLALALAYPYCRVRLLGILVRQQMRNKSMLTQLKDEAENEVRAELADLMAAKFPMV